ncbi:hypothetical protein N7463_001836 [Penicillium fimorum]|uniref:Epidermal growth factor receptor-like transmembrane-juxtamembrane segment domain-containing protein n=1 Tax=Penicillium fimorum TaxID=1882269 RepID=A0A9X0C8F0_9EURO|nr:hypothetical protein N7463_001836 [Penicillium fimorum]
MPKDSSGPPYGFAIRRKTNCLAGEGRTIASAGFVRCCPSGSAFNDANTGMCCPSEEDCRSEISNPPHCADEAWLLFENEGGGYFCCEDNLVGFHMKTGVGCAEKDDPKYPDVHSATSSSSTMSSNSITSTSSATSNSSPTTSTSSSSSNTGAIAGGVVGGVAGLAIILVLLWYFMRRRRQKQPHRDPTPVTEAAMRQYQPVQTSQHPSELDSPSTKPSELEDQVYVPELPNYKNNPLVHELPENSRT